MGIILRHVNKNFGMPPTRVLRDINLEIKDGEFVSITGRSGSGKSTLLYILSTLDVPSTGQVEIAGHDVVAMTSRELHQFRNSHVGFVFQFHHLLPELTVLENVLLPARKSKRSDERRPYAMALLEQFGIANKAKSFPRQISGGESQRAALARALVMQPHYVFADEPTGNLDSANADTVMQIFARMNKEQNTTIVMVTHDLDYASLATRQINMVDGILATHP